MTDRPEKSTHIDAEGPGIQLRRAREKRGLVLHDVAQELHLDEWMLQALEEDDFTALGAPVFAKGHMRKYGTMLGLNSDDLMIAYYRKRGRDDSPPPITKTMAPEPRNPSISVRGLGWGLAVLAAIIVLYLLWAVLSRTKGPQTPATAPAAPSMSQESSPVGLPETSLAGLREGSPVVLQEAPDQTAADQPPRSAMDGVTPVPSTGVTEQPSASGNVNSARPAAPADDTAAPAADIATPAEISVSLTVNGESWVEVTDSSGRQLVYDMMSAGRSRTVSGRPPIEIFLGNSRAVQVDVDGQFYPIPRRAVRGNTARFVIDSSSR